MRKYTNKIICGDCLEVMKRFPDNHFDSIVTDPPAGIAFMGKDWDKDKGGRDNWIGWMTEIMQEALRVIKPGGHALIWALPRTSHWTATAVENAGFEIRDVVSHIFGSGFPKALDIGKAIDNKLGQEREVVGRGSAGKTALGQGSGWNKTYNPHEYDITVSTSDIAKKWDGWKTGLKPSCEFWVLARKPISEPTIAENVMKWGAGGINIDGCRISTNDNLNGGGYSKNFKGSSFLKYGGKQEYKQPTGRFPSHLIIDSEVGAIIDEQSGITKSSSSPRHNKQSVYAEQEYRKYGKFDDHVSYGHSDTGGASRFFHVADYVEGELKEATRFLYCPKASRAERNIGLEGMEKKHASHDGREAYIDNPYQRHSNIQSNHHPTVKPIKLMEYLVKMITPEDGLVLDMFAGSGSTALGCINTGRNFIGIELDEEYAEIARARIKGIKEKHEGKLFRPHELEG